MAPFTVSTSINLNKMTTEQPTIVIVPGAWSAPAAYRKLVNALEAKSYTVHVPALPTNNGARPPNSSYEADVKAVREVVKPLVDDGNELILIMHSYGGAVGTSAVESLACKDRQALGLTGGVVHLLYVSAYLLEKGESVWKLVEKAGVPKERGDLVNVEEDGTWLPKDIVWGLYHDLDPEDQEEQKSLVKPHFLPAVNGEVTYEAWKDIPCSYVYTTEDRWVPTMFQDICISNARDAGVPIDVHAFNCAHSAYAKYPDKLAELVFKISGSE